jgi:hypothetical protein
MELIKLREISEKFAKDNLRKCAEELLVMKQTSILPNGKVRELANLVSNWAGKADALTIAESIIIKEAIKHAANSLPETPTVG